MRSFEIETDDFKTTSIRRWRIIKSETWSIRQRNGDRKKRASLSIQRKSVTKLKVMPKGREKKTQLCGPKAPSAKTEEKNRRKKEMKGEKIMRTTFTCSLPMCIWHTFGLHNAMAGFGPASRWLSRKKRRWAVRKETKSLTYFTSRY